LADIVYIKPEFQYKNSRIDFFIETKDKKILAEVKGVTLEDNGVAMFPDAPTLRGVKHVNELKCAVEEGYDAYVFFIIQMKGISYLTPNYKTHKDFGDALFSAYKNSVNIVAVDCVVTHDSITADKFIDFKF